MKGNGKLKAQPSTQSSQKTQFYSYLVEMSQKSTLNFYFKSRFSVKPSKFQIYLAKDCK